jgi:hypothetical protein
MKLVYESLEELFESPDEISLPNLTYNRFGEPMNNDMFKSPHFSDDDARAFWYEDGNFHLGSAGQTHPEGIRKEGFFSGRVWTDKKLISFWEYPAAEEFLILIADLEKELGQPILGKRWKVEVLDGKWRKEDNFQTELVPIKDYQGSEQRSEEDLGKEHIKSPLLKDKKLPQGWGSTHPEYQKRRAWQVASMTSESLDFERGLEPKEAMNIGRTRTAEINHAGDGSYVYITVGKNQRRIRVGRKYNGDDGNDLLWKDIEKKAWEMGARKIHDPESDPELWRISSENIIAEGVADKYGARAFGLPDDGEEFNKSYQRNKSGKTAAEAKGVEIIKNPKSLEGFAKGIRAVITKNGDLYVAADMEVVIHVDILKALHDKGLVLGDPTGWEVTDETPKIDFITVQRVWGKNKFAIGESYVLPKSKSPEERTQALKFFEPFLQKAREINPQFEYVDEQVRVVARKTLKPEEYEEFKKLGS